MYKKLIVAVVVFLVAILLVVLGTQALTKSSEAKEAQKVADNFVSLMLAGKAQESYDLLSTQAQKIISADEWKDTNARVAIFFTARKPTFESTKSTGKGHAIVRYSIDGNDGKYVFTVTMVKEGAVWKVDVFDSSLQK